MKTLSIRLHFFFSVIQKTKFEKLRILVLLKLALLNLERERERCFESYQ